MSKRLPKIRPFKRGPGLTVPEYFTRGLVHPFEGVTFRKTDAVIRDWKTGQETFRQNDFEVTAEHTDQDAAVIASKYARAALGTAKRETSVKQIVMRVVEKIADWGVNSKYFTKIRDYDVFKNELARILITRKAAFNSPVWFNFGVDGSPQQGSACMPYDVRVNTNLGLIAIGDVVRLVNNGTEIYTYDKDGSPTKILAGICNGKKSVLRFDLSNGAHLDMTGNHVVFIQGPNGPQEKAASELVPGDELILSRNTLMSDMDTMQVGLWTVDQDLAWIAGIMVGDGYSGRSPTATSDTWEIKINTKPERELAEKILNKYGISYVVTEFHWGWNLRGYSHTGRALWEGLGLWDKTKNKVVPEWVFCSGAKLAGAFLRGLFDSDGTVVQASSNDRVVVQLANTSKNVIDGAHKLLMSMGIFSQRTEYTDTRPAHKRKVGFKLSVSDVKSVSLYEDKVGFTHTKKIAQMDARNKEGTGYKTDTVMVMGRHRRSASELVYDIQTESGTFWAEGILVHNCFINGVDDSMESILGLCQIEGMQFKGGSGAGSNVSAIRSKRETMSGGGAPSGPLSFMSGLDGFAGVIKSGGKTRRSALMRILDEDHPDILDFVQCKVLEEAKALALINAGYSGGFEGEAYTSVDYQNANNSVHVSDDTMAAVASGNKHLISLRARTTGEILDTLDAHTLMGKIADAAWRCGDPGLHFDMINQQNKVPSLGPIVASNPCSEFVHVNDTSCNLASLNLREFQRADGTLDIEAFQAAIEILIIAQEIIVDNAHYPTEQIAHKTRLTRPLGLGYCNLGAFLMAAGWAYDSIEARTIAFGITSLLTATAYRTSAIIARDHGGPFQVFPENRDAMFSILNDYAWNAAHTPIGPSRQIQDRVHCYDPVLDAVLEATWGEALDLGYQYGFRNDEVTALAPTGTISFLMSADTTGCEPDIALVKYKALAGGGAIKIVNRTVGAGLIRLGYDHAQRQAILSHIEATDTIEGAPGLHDRHLPVFDCAFRAKNGKRSISWKGHVLMMAALQAGVSMAISKTVNLPNDATVKDMLDAYVLAWQTGVKALACFRDGSKGVQPVSTTQDTDKPEKAPEKPQDASKDVQATDMPRQDLDAPRPTRTMLGARTKIDVGGTEGYVRTSHDRNGRIVEVFLTFTKHGSIVSGLMDTIAILISKDLRRGVALTEIVDSIKATTFTPSGWTRIETSDGESQSLIASSIVDALCKWLMAEYPGGIWVGPVAPVSVTTLKVPLKDGGSITVKVAGLSQDKAPVQNGSAPTCGKCGGIKVPNGPRCFFCSTCGDKEGGCG